MKRLPKLEDIMNNRKKLAQWLTQMEKVYNAILENQEAFANGHNEHDERLDKIEEFIREFKHEEK